MKRFLNKNVLVTGAASGIGKAAAHRIALEGANLALIDINAQGLQQVKDEIVTKNNNTVLYHTCNIANHDETILVINNLVAQLGSLNALSHNVGIMKLFKTHEMTSQQWQNIIDVNLSGTFNVNKAALPHLIKNSESYIVNTASSAVSVPHPWLSAYSASKGGIVAFTRSIALEYHLQGLRANSLLPGGVTTPLSNEFNKLLPKDVNLSLLKNLKPISGAELADPKDIASVIALLASHEAKNITATEFLVDRGNF